MKTLSSCESKETALNVNRKLPKGKKKKPDPRVNKGKEKSVLEFLQGALNYFNGNPMPCTTALNCLENACRMELLLQTAVKNVQHVIVQTAQK